ncbi:hypothetical protein QWZ16_17845 [Vibrio ostreicida]|uniref:Uncharacterized protein n=1 Tax=Vibrio ostreicida TaxID=526588 RepID=A0ABT8BYL8_9VIBR|nr:hypothetical protein [Vibrio ostreicida]MDN3611464.1 hypothetical protein [Vibrio ostreicida]
MFIILSFFALFATNLVVIGTKMANWSVPISIYTLEWLYDGLMIE